MKNASIRKKQHNGSTTRTEAAPALAPAAPVTAETLREGISPAIVAKIQQEAEATTQRKAPAELPVPFATYLAEAHGLAATIAKYWRSPDPKRIPSLAPFATRLPESTSAEIVHLVDLLHGARDKARALAAVADPQVLARAAFVYRELRAAAEFDADDGVDDQRDLEIAALRRSHEREPGSIAELADALASFAAHVSAHRASFEVLPDFDLALVDEAARLTDALRLRKTSGSAAADLAAAVRDTYLALLDRRVASARKVFRYVYRAHPAVAREATSAYERERRRATRKPDPSEGDELTDPVPAPEDGSSEEVRHDG